MFTCIFEVVHLYLWMCSPVSFNLYNLTFQFVNWNLSICSLLSFPVNKLKIHIHDFYMQWKYWKIQMNMLDKFWPLLRLHFTCTLVFVDSKINWQKPPFLIESKTSLRPGLSVLPSVGRSGCPNFLNRELYVNFSYYQFITMGSLYKIRNNIFMHAKRIISFFYNFCQNFSFWRANCVYVCICKLANFGDLPAFCFEESINTPFIVQK